MAFGAIQALAEAGRRVPADVAMMGFDGMEDDSLAQFSLSTVAQPVADLGRAAVEILLRLIDQPEQGPIQRFLPTRLMLRRSCGCAEASVPAPPEVGYDARWVVSG